MMEDWPFQNSQDSMVYTLVSIMNGKTPILLVYHDPDDESWQFLDGAPVSNSNALAILLKDIVELDSSVADLADLPLGWQASRKVPRGSWHRERK